MPEKQSPHPLMFTFRDIISGTEFLVGITVSGRALMVQECDDEWWMYGVRPGSIAEVGKTAEEALARFKNKYREILFDIAGEFRDFVTFKGEVERFFYELDREEERRWEKAVNEMRSGNLMPPPPLSKLPREAPESRPTQITVERLDGESKRFMPTDNVPDIYRMPLAA